MTKSGLLIKASVNSLPLINHYGITLNHNGNLFVLHNTPGKSSVIEPFEKWIQSRKVIQVTETKLVSMSNNMILQKFKSVCQRQYNLFSYNCDHFIDCMLDEKHKSEQLVKWTFISVVSLFLYSYLKK